jgi:hypothetical protein
VRFIGTFPFAPAARPRDEWMARCHAATGRRRARAHMTTRQRQPWRMVNETFMRLFSAYNDLIYCLY